MPKPWTHALWMTETAVTAHKRSTALKAVDDALRAYEGSNEFNRRKALNLLLDAYEDWQAGKDDPAASIRNKRGTLLADFEVWLTAQEDLLLPTPEAGWSGTPNCYGYAMKCKVIPGQAPTPGAAADETVLSGDPRYARASSKLLYHRALLQGIVADAQACGKVVEVLREPTDAAYPSPKNPPTERTGGAHYLAAMIGKADGFHFMRRDSRSGLWSHKNGGADAEVETGAHLLGSGGRTRVRNIPITDDVAVELLECTSGKYLAFTGFTFVGYVLVPHAGIQVAGAFGR